MTNCVCPLKGFCERHGVEKSGTLHKLCQENDKYFDAWERCEGPRQGEDCVPRASRGLGDTVAKIIKKTGLKKAHDFIKEKITGKKGGCGGCSKRQKRLNDLVPYEDNEQEKIDGSN